MKSRDHRSPKIRGGGSCLHLLAALLPTNWTIVLSCLAVGQNREKLSDAQIPLHCDSGKNKTDYRFMGCILIDIVKPSPEIIAKKSLCLTCVWRALCSLTGKHQGGLPGPELNGRERRAPPPTGKGDTSTVALQGPVQGAPPGTLPMAETSLSVPSLCCKGLCSPCPVVLGQRSGHVVDCDCASTCENHRLARGADVAPPPRPRFPLSGAPAATCSRRGGSLAAGPTPPDVPAGT